GCGRFSIRRLPEPDAHDHGDGGALDRLPDGSVQEAQSLRRARARLDQLSFARPALLCSLKRPLIRAQVPLRAPVTLCIWSSPAATTQLRPRLLARYSAWSAWRKASSKLPPAGEVATPKLAVMDSGS